MSTPGLAAFATPEGALLPLGRPGAEN